MSVYIDNPGTAIDYAIASASVEEIDAINILQASLLAMQRAVLQLTQPISQVLIDGNKAPNLPYHEIIKGDTAVPQIMAASILAKVARDHYMQKLSLIYPQYQFEKHKGYPTKLHRELLSEFGPSSVHRKSFKTVREL